MEYKICIPSKGRAGLITTQKVFRSATIYVPNSELSSYAMYNNVEGVPNEIKGITATRNWILRNNNENVFFIDDDFQYGGYVHRETEKYKVIRVTDEQTYKTEISKMFELCYQLNSKICGFFTVGNNLTNYPYNPYLLNGVCLGSCMGMVNDGTYYFNEDYEVKEDYELTLRCIKDGIGTVRGSVLFMQHEHTQLKGGCRDSGRIEKEKKAIKQLIREYPNCIKSAKNRGTSFAIQLNI